MLPITKEKLKSYRGAKVCYISGKRIWKKLSKITNYCKVWDHWNNTCKYRGPVYSICNWKFNLPNEIHVVFYNCSNWGYRFIIKKLVNEFVR